MTVAIVGGGIAGLATAIALGQRDIDAQVYERASALRPVGAGIGLAPNAMAVLERLNLADAVEADGVSIQRTIFQTAEGRPILSYDFAARDAVVNRPIVMIRRSTLQALLVDELGTDGLSLGRGCIGLDQGDDGATVRFDGDPIEARLVVGADGIGSVVRREIDPGRPIRQTGHTTYRGIASHSDPAMERSVGREVWGRDGRFGFAPVDESAVYWFADVAADRQPNDPETMKRQLLDRYGSYPEPIRSLLEGTPAAEIIHTPVTDLPPPDFLTHGRIVLVGDAAHAVTPDLAQGAAQALEDAVALATRLEDCESLRGAFEAYETARLDRVRRIARDSRRFRRVAHLHWKPAIRLRNALARHAPRRVVERQFRRTFTPAI